MTYLTVKMKFSKKLKRLQVHMVQCSLNTNSTFLGEKIVTGSLKLKKCTSVKNEKKTIKSKHVYFGKNKNMTFFLMSQKLGS